METQTDTLAQIYFQKMSQAKMAHGCRILDQELNDGGGSVSHEALFLATQHYALAIGYLNQSLTQPVDRDALVWQVHNCFKRCRIEDIRYLQNEAIPIIRHTFGLDTSILDEALNCALLATQGLPPG
jgi:hypothetical protein